MLLPPPRLTLFPYTTLFRSDDFRLKRNLTLNLGVRWEGVRPPHEIKDRFSYGYGGDYNNEAVTEADRKSTRLNSSHRCISYAVFCLKKKKNRHANPK